MDIRVLIVEDEPVAALAHASYVAKVPGFTTVAVAHTLRDAVAAVVKEKPDLALLDLNLPDGHGLDLVRSLRGTGRPVDVLAVTAAREVPVVRAAVSLGVVGYLLKPFVFADLKERLNAYLEYRNRLVAADSTNQAEVDQLLQDLHRPPSPASMPKGLSRDVLSRVEDALRDSTSPDGASASQIAEAVGASRVTARRYLEHLVERGAVRRGQRLGGAGRPEVTFQWKQ